MRRLRVNLDLEHVLIVGPALRRSTEVGWTNATHVAHRHGAGAVLSVIGHTAGCTLTSVESGEEGVSVHYRNRISGFSTRMICNNDRGLLTYAC